ncbi:MAG: tRNA 2-thiouridine(34) synthase MnmA [Deltaproteobacteria bacterium]|nr:tRNA 2-thiouridine(34) synthase MnmA [Deltaproteobacteria bacterium]
MRKAQGEGRRVAVAMSGGVDSSVAAVLLRDAGYDVVGVTMTLWSCHRSDRARKQTCCSTLDVEDARAVCERLGIPHVVADFRTEFRAQVIQPFVEEYARARTPIPCIGCNQHFKFDRLWSLMQQEYGAEYLATGHYARRVPTDGDGGLVMQRAADQRKDQTYYLFIMTAAQLTHTLFPLGTLKKEEVRAIAARHGLVTAEKPESFEICFVPDNDYAGFIEDFFPEHAGHAGPLINAAGEVVGRHRGTHAYTIGQRRGIGQGFGERRYVTAIDATGGSVTVGPREALARMSLTASTFNWLTPAPSVGTVMQATAKIRAQHTPAACTARVCDTGDIQVEFCEPQYAVTPGQAVVLYDHETVLGGGWIA